MGALGLWGSSASRVSPRFTEEVQQKRGKRVVILGTHGSPTDSSAADTNVRMPSRLACGNDMNRSSTDPCVAERTSDAGVA